MNESETDAGRWAERARAAARHRQNRTWPPPPPTEAPAPSPAPAPPVVESEQPAPQQPAQRQPTPTPKVRWSKAAVPVVSEATAAAASNPFLPTARDQQGQQADEERGDVLADLELTHAVGPSSPPVAPAPLNPALRVPAQWPNGPAPVGTLVQLVGLHGGAGTSTMAAMLGEEAIDCGQGLDNLVTLSLPVLFVARSHAHGLDLALRIGQQHASRTLEPLMVLGIVVVHDGPSLSKGLARTLTSVEKSLPNSWTLPWSEDIRHDPALPEAATSGRAGRDTRRILKKASQLRASREPSSNHATM